MMHLIPYNKGLFLNNFLLDYCDSIKYADFTSVEMLKCGNSDIYIKPECVCSFYNVFEATLYHEYSSCPEDQRSDIVTQLNCRYKIVIMNNFSFSYANHKYFALSNINWFNTIACTKNCMVCPSMQINPSASCCNTQYIKLTFTF